MFNFLKKNHWIPVIVLFVLVLSACQSSPLNQPNVSDQPRTISVEGTGKVSLDPSLARISIGVQTENESAQEAVSKNSEKVEQMMAVLEEFGIPKEDIQTANFNIHRQDNRDRPEKTLPESSDAYIVSNIVRVTLRDLDELGALLDEAVQAGANTVNNIQFDAQDKEKANKKALELAMQDARARAETIAESADVELGEVYQVETFGGGPVLARQEVEEEAAGAAAVPISPGQLDIQVRVNVRYQIAK